MPLVTVKCELSKQPIVVDAVTLFDLKRKLGEMFELKIDWHFRDVQINNGRDKVSYTGDTYLMPDDDVTITRLEKRKI